MLAVRVGVTPTFAACWSACDDDWKLDWKTPLGPSLLLLHIGSAGLSWRSSAASDGAQFHSTSLEDGVGVSVLMRFYVGRSSTAASKSAQGV
jgi:hypothetical protein